MKKFIPTLIALFVLLLIYGSFYFSTSAGENGIAMTEGVGTYSEGFRTGYVIKVSNKGTLKSSCEVDIILGYDARGFFPSSSSSSDGSVSEGYQPIWSFSVPHSIKDEVVSKLENAMTDRNRIVVRYEQKQIKGVAVDTSYLATSIEIVEN